MDSKEYFPPRGINPETLLFQVNNTAPYLFSDAFWQLPLGRVPHLERLYEVNQKLKAVSLEFNHAEYFTLCVSAHHATVGTYVPTDVDNQIRWKLWHPMVDRGELEAMAYTVLESLSWDFRWLRTRFVTDPLDRELNGHHGEWFSTAVGAYGAFRKKKPELAKKIAEAIFQEVERERDIWFRIWQARDIQSLLKASMLVAHNLGDLQRVIEMWEMESTDPFVETVQKELDCPFFKAASVLNKDMMANENHRHFALRKARSLRKFRELLLPLGPFFDDWGKKVATHPEISLEDLGQIIEALVDGYVYLEGKAIGYARALCGIEQTYPGGLKTLENTVPRTIFKKWTTSDLRKLCSVEQSRFEKQWETMAWNKMKLLSLPREGLFRAKQGRVVRAIEIDQRAPSTQQ